MNNSVFGKTMENLRNRMRVELVNCPKKLKKLVAKPNLESFRIFNSDLAAVHMGKIKLYLNRPIYVGFAILDISKILMLLVASEYITHFKIFNITGDCLFEYNT